MTLDLTAVPSTPCCLSPDININDLRRRAGLGDPTAIRQLCEMNDTPVPEFARLPQSANAPAQITATRQTQLALDLPDPEQPQLDLDC